MKVDWTVNLGQLLAIVVPVLVLGVGGLVAFRELRVLFAVHVREDERRFDEQGDELQRLRTRQHDLGGEIDQVGRRCEVGQARLSGRVDAVVQMHGMGRKGEPDGA